ncbi:hypothetical protein AO374_1857 [Moraxella catarrhalis]|nr:hypothetical protein AO374_1857 [Moraxella catarrhalis]
MLFVDNKKVIKNILIKPREMIYDSTLSETLKLKKPNGLLCPW